MTNNLPRSIEELSWLLENGASFNLNAAIESISTSSNSSHHDTKTTVDKFLSTLVQKRLISAVNSHKESAFIQQTSLELQSRFGIDFIRLSDYIRPELGRYFHDEFVQHLKHEIKKNTDINKKVFIESYLRQFASLFCLSRQDIHNYNLSGLLHRYFPSDDFHSVKARNSRKHIIESRFERDLLTLREAFQDGERAIRNSDKGKFIAGEMAEVAWLKIIEEYFGQQFDVHSKKPIHTDLGRLPEFDIVICKKDITHKTRAKIDFIHADNVVAAFEIKRTLLKEQVGIHSKKAKEIFDDRCMNLKKAVMPDQRSLDIGTTPYQMLRGKIYFGVLSLDVESAALDAVLSGDNHAERHLKKIPLGDEDNIFEFTDLGADVIYCPERLIWVKESKLMPGSLDEQLDMYWAQLGENDIDRSVSSFGCLIASIRRFLIAQGHISKESRKDYIDSYQYFSVLTSASSRSRILIRPINWNLPKHLRRLDLYLRTQVPNEYSAYYLSSRQPLEVLKQWTTDAAQDVHSYVKNNLKRIVKLEQQMNYRPLPLDVTLHDESFDSYYDSLFAD